MPTTLSEEAAMHRMLLAIVFVIAFDVTEGQDFSGSYVYRDQGLDAKLTLSKSTRAEFGGTLEAGGNRLKVTGKEKNGVLSGVIGDEPDGFTFEARLKNNQLSFVMVEMSNDGRPIPETAQTYVFSRGSSPASSPRQKEQRADGKVIINGLVLTEAQIAGLAKTYGVKALPGNFWYDTRSGLYGVVGYPAFGFMLPGHQFGTLKRDASQGNTTVFVNGRELPLAEYTVWSQMVGSWIQPGKYWLDAQGNAGYEGNPAPVINLYALARQNSYRGQGGRGGDNFWSSRFSAGNSNADNSQGYVSVPGYGPVGYGF